MKVAVFSDVQANYPALQAAIEHILDGSPDLVIMNGDLINRGPRSLECLELFESLREDYGWIALRGNHEDFVLKGSVPHTSTDSPVEREMQRFTDWTCRQLGEKIKVVESWQDRYRFHPPEDERAWVTAMHGSVVGNRIGISPETPVEELEKRVPDGQSVFVTAHTHRPFTRDYNDCQIVNAGSIGSPFDGDPRASYARLEFKDGGWEADIVRFEYDRVQADLDYHSTGFLDTGGAIARLIYEEWKRASSLMPGWRKRFYQAVMDEEISLQLAVDTYLSDLD